MNQGELFGVPPAQRHSATSRAAADAIEASVPRLRRLVLNHLRRCPDGSTDEEGIAALSLPPNTYRPRRIELTAAGMVRDSGRTRRTVAGRKAVVWEAAL